MLTRLLNMTVDLTVVIPANDAVGVTVSQTTLSVVDDDVGQCEGSGC